jgi:hypothetical protein
MSGPPPTGARSTAAQPADSRRRRSRSVRATPESSTATTAVNPVAPLAARAELQAAVGNREMLRRMAPAVQTKLRVSEPGDAHEREADRVAAAVMARPEPTVQRQTDTDVDIDEEELAATRQEPARQTDTDVDIEPDEEEIAATTPEVARQTDTDVDIEPDEEEIAATTPEVARQADIDIEEDEEEVAAAKADAQATMTPTVEGGIARSHGGGHPLDTSTRTFFEPRFGRDLGGVKVHTDSHAARLASDLQAQAFTVGNDIYFSPGRYQPGSDAGRSLLAHELTHTIQQQPGARLEPTTDPASTATAADRQVQCQPTTTATTADTPDPGDAESALRTFHLPEVKARHLQLYQAWAAGGQLRRNKDYSRGTSPEDRPDQRNSVWVPTVRDSLDPAILQRLDLDGPFSGEKVIKATPSRTLTGSRASLLEQLTIPKWDRSGKDASYDVDHIVELQVAGWPAGAGNTIENMELLQARANRSSGGKTRSNVAAGVREYLTATGEGGSGKNVKHYLAANDVLFNRAVLGTGNKAGRVRETSSQWWTRAEIQRGDHLARATVIGNLAEVGSPREFALLSPLTIEPGGEQRGGRALLALFTHDRNQLRFPVRARERDRVAGLSIREIALNDGYTKAAESADIGSVQARWALPAAFDAPSDVITLPLRKMPGNQYAGYLDDLPSLNLTFPKLSSIQFGRVGADGGGLNAEGRLLPSVPLLDRVPIDVRLRGDDIEFAMDYAAEDLNLPVPLIDVTDAGVSLFYSTRHGFGAEGSIGVAAERLGTGRLGVRATRGELAVEGSFDFDTQLFDEASVDLWYRDGSFGGAGTLAITRPDKLPGVRSARVTASFGSTGVTAQGTVQPAIPGLEQGELSVQHSEEEGLVIGGTLALAKDIPGLASGSVDVTVRKASQEEGWVVGASGQAVPDIPGVDAQIAVSYADGVFTAEGTAAYSRGMLSGSLQVGATNRPVDDQGNPGEGATPQLRAFGGGSLTLRIAPWLAATAGVRLLPNGEVEVSGQVGLPEVLEVFPARRYDRNLFRISLDIPIVGVSVLGKRIGIFATIGGGLDLTAGFGPGQLQQLQLGVTYNPDHEDQTQVTGQALFVVPADAGLRLFVQGSLGAGIPVVSASVGLELGGRLGIRGEVRAGVEVAWSPTEGLALDAVAAISAEPRFRFDITGFVLVKADLWVRTIKLYSKRWELAAVEYGSGLQLGASFPIHYREGEPFDVALDDIQFQVPDIDPKQVLKGLVAQIA